MCTLFCGWWLITGCSQLPSQVAVESTTAPTLTTAAPVMSLTVLPPTALPPQPTRTASVTTSAAPQPVRALSPTPVAPALSAPAPSAPAAVGTVVVYTESITLPTYPFERYQIDAIDPTYNWPYKRFDVERFRTEAPMPELRDYQLLVLENAYLKVLILPALGGRIWQVIHKPSGAPIFYQNTVVKPTHWGFADQLGWLALGGLEWSLPVIEHGYDWGTPWGSRAVQERADLATVTVFTPDDGRLLSASIKIVLRAGTASFAIEPTLTNLADKPLAFSFWHDAMLAPGSGKRPSAQLHFVLPADTMTLHSTGDTTMPPAASPFAWPVYQARDLSRLGNFTQYLGFFEAPAAHGPFVGVYDPIYDAGVVRVFPAQVVRGSKVFALGWQDALASSNYTDDDSVYVELHGGLAPTFADHYTLPAGTSVDWREVWYPVQGIGDLTYANEVAALAVQESAEALGVKLYATRPLAGKLVLVVEGQAVAQLTLQAEPAVPFQGSLPFAPIATYTVELYDNNERLLLTYTAAQ